MSKTDLWIFGEDGRLQNFDAEHCQASRTRSVNSKNKYFGRANLKDGGHCLDLHGKGEVLREQNDIITKKNFDTPTMFREGFGVLSVKPITGSSKKREKRQSLKVMIENLPNLSQDRSQCANASENIKDDIVVKKILSNKSDTVYASNFSQGEIPEALDLRTTDKNNVSKNCLIKDNTCAKADSCTISSPATEAITSSQCHNIAFQSDFPCLGHQPKVNVSDCAEYLSTMPEGHVQAGSNVLDEDLLVKSSMTEENIQATRGLGLVVAKPNTLVTLPPLEVLKTPTSISAVVGFENVSVSPSDIMADSDGVGIHTCVPDSKCSSDCDIASVIGSPMSVSHLSMLENENSLVEYLADASRATQLKSTCIQTDPGPTSASPAAQLKSTCIQTDPGPTSASPATQLKSTCIQTDPGPTSASPATQLKSTCIQTDLGQTPESLGTQLKSTCIQTDPGPTPESPGTQLNSTCIQTDPGPTPESPETQLKSTCIQTDPGPTSMSQRTRKRSENPLTQLEVKSKRKKTRDLKYLKPNTSAQISGSDSSTSSVYQQDSSVLTVTVDEPNRLVSNEMVDKYCRVDKKFDVSTATDKEPAMTDTDAVGTRTCVPDPKCSSDGDITSVIDSPVSVSQMSLLANENSLIKYLTDVSWKTQLMSSCIQTDVGPPSKSRRARKCPLTNLNVKLKRTKTRHSKHLKQQVKGVPKTTTTAFLTNTCSDSFNSSVRNKSTDSLFAGENRITTESANDVQRASTESGSEFRIKTEPSNNDEFSAAILGKTFGIKSEPLDDDEQASAQCQSKDHSSKLPESRHTNLHSLSKPETNMSLTDGATKSHKYNSDMLAGIATSNGLSSNVSCEKYGYTQQLQQPVEQISPRPISMATALQTDSALPIKISSVFSLKSHSYNMSIQDIVNTHEQDKGVSVSEGTSSEIHSDHSNSKNLNTIKFPEEMKSDLCLRSPCRVVLEKIQMKNGRVLGSKCTKTCRQRFLSTKEKFYVSRIKRSNTNNDVSCMHAMPQMRIGTGFNTMGVHSTDCHSSLPVSTRIYAVHPATRTSVPPVRLPPDATRTGLYLQPPNRPTMRSFRVLQLPKGNPDHKKYYMINVQGRNIVIPSVSLNTPRSVSYQQTLKRLTTRSFPGMQLSKTSSEHQSSNSSHVPNPSIKTEPNTQRRDDQSATMLLVAKPDAVGRNIVIPSARLNTPRIVSCQQTLKRLTAGSFPGMQLPKTFSGHQSSNSSHVPNLSIKTEPNTQRRDDQSATMLLVAKPDAVAAEVK
ncbi:uncharacterized protein LOC110454777 [Mizuhopecten yessoensis]|uniref:uncharacterized protein LOC110454777 n=1 Tax=Mizuhopecten yessoensis TaxID=6573 RepID=UPI000B45A299|nr:uncharacterized protein LOC110454777 [Mizuhopecten yessoensis]